MFSDSFNRIWVCSTDGLIFVVGGDNYQTGEKVINLMPSTETEEGNLDVTSGVHTLKPSEDTKTLLGKAKLYGRSYPFN